MLRQLRDPALWLRELTCRIKGHKPADDLSALYCARCFDALPDWPEGKRDIGDSWNVNWDWAWDDSEPPPIRWAFSIGVWRYGSNIYIDLLVGTINISW